MLGPLLILAWFAALCLAFVAIGLGQVRGGTRGLVWGALAFVGALMMFGLLSTVIGLLEFGAMTTQGWLTLSIGLAGVALYVVGVRGALIDRRAKPGACPKCGYELADLDQCPECGASG